MGQKQKETIWTVRPDCDVETAMGKAINARARRTGENKNKLRSSIINEGLRKFLQDFYGKREARA